MLEHAEAVYLPDKGWFWCVHIGNRIIYWGPYKSKEEAEGHEANSTEAR